MTQAEYSAQDIAAALGISARAIQKKAKAEKWKYQDVAIAGNGGKRRVYPIGTLPVEIQTALARHVGLNALQAWPPRVLHSAAIALVVAELEARAGDTTLPVYQDRGLSLSRLVPEGVGRVISIQDPRTLRDDRVLARLRIVAEAEKIPATWTDGRRKWVEHVAMRHGVSWQTVYKWMDIQGKQGPDGFLHGAKRRADTVYRVWSPEAVRYWEGLILKREHRKMAKKDLYRHLLAEAAQRGWRVGTYESALLHAKKIPLTLLTYRDQGERGLDNLLPPIMRDYADLAPLEIIVGDQHRYDCWVQCEVTGDVFRPEGYLWQDLCTRAIYGIALGRKYDSIMIGDALEMGLRLHGRFGAVYTDNGKPETAKYFLERRREMASSGLEHSLTCDGHGDDGTAGVLTDLGAGRRLAIVRNAKAKMIEGTFSVMEEILRGRFGVPGTVKQIGGNKEQGEIDQDEVERLARAGRLMSFGAFARTLFAACDYYNREHEHRGLREQLCREAERKGFAAPKAITPHGYLEMRLRDGWRPSYLAPETLDMIFRHRARRTVNQGRVQLKDRRWQATRHFEHEALVALTGQKVECRYDPLNPDAPVVIMDLDGRWLCDAEVMGYGSMKDAELTRAKIHEKRTLRRDIRDLWRGRTAGVLDVRTYGTGSDGTGVENQAAIRAEGARAEALVAAERHRTRSDDELAAEIEERTRRTAEHHAEQARLGRERRLAEIGPAQEFWLDDFEHYRWTQAILEAGGVLDDSETAFFRWYEAERMTEDARMIWMLKRGERPQQKEAGSEERLCGNG